MTPDVSDIHFSFKLCPDMARLGNELRVALTHYDLCLSKSNPLSLELLSSLIFNSQTLSVRD